MKYALYAIEADVSYFSNKFRVILSADTCEITWDVGVSLMIMYYQPKAEKDNQIVSFFIETDNNLTLSQVSSLIDARSFQTLFYFFNTVLKTYEKVSN